MKICFDRKRLFKLLLFISFFLITILTNTQTVKAACKACCAGLCGPGGCRVMQNPNYCYTSEVYKICDGVNMCCDPGDCLTCTPECGEGYQASANSCPTTAFTCHDSTCLGTSCGQTRSKTCYRVLVPVDIITAGGTCAADHNACYNLASTAPACYGYTGHSLTGYTLGGTGCTGSFNTSTGVCSQVTGDISVTANWQLASYTINYDGNGGTCTPTSRPATYGSSDPGPTSCSRDYYTLTGYSVTSGSCGGTFTPSTGACSFVSEAMTITASWVLTNNNPNAPTTPYCNGTTNPTNVTTANPTFSAIFSDPDSTDTGNYYEIEVNTASNFGGTVKWDTGIQGMTATTNGYRSPDFTYAGSSLGWSGVTYYWRIRFGDNHGAMSDWSATQNFTMHSNSAPTVPTSLLTEGATNPTEVIDLTPEFSAIFNDPNTGDTGVQYEIEVNTSSAFSGTVMWDSNLTSMTATAIGARSPNISYAGTALSLNGATYYWRIRFVDNYGGLGAWSSTAQFTMNNLPYATDLTTETYIDPIKVYDITPEFRARFNDADSGATGIYFQINVNTASNFSGITMWDSNKTSMTAVPAGSLIADKSYAGSALSLNGNIYYWRIKFWDENNSESAWSSTANFRMSGPPNAPSFLLTDGQTNPLYLNSTTPSFSAIYTDINLDNSSAYEIEVNTQSDFLGTTMWDTGKQSITITSGSRSSDITYAGTPLTGTSNITYYWRMRFWDIDDNVSSWSSVNTFRDSLMHLYLNGLKLNGIKID